LSSWLPSLPRARTAKPSVVAPGTHGSGNKTLHNVTGRVGVVEGARGDLRTGLPRQALHDGRRWVHEPLRLEVVVEATPAAIDSVLARHPSIGELVTNGWLRCHALAGDGRSLLTRDRQGRWQAFPATPERAAA